MDSNNNHNKKKTKTTPSIHLILYSYIEDHFKFYTTNG